MKRLSMIVPVAVSVATAQLSAHDSWLAATTWTPGADGKATISAGAGEKFPTRTNFRSRDN